MSSLTQIVKTKTALKTNNRAWGKKNALETALGVRPCSDIAIAHKPSTSAGIG